MQLPTHLSRYIADRSEHDLPLTLQRIVETQDRECEGAQHHSPRPLFLIVTPLAPIEVEVHNAPTALLCGTCQDNLQVYLALLWATEGEIPWAFRREFGNLVRALGDRGWAHYRKVLEAA